MLTGSGSLIGPRPGVSEGADQVVGESPAGPEVRNLQPPGRLVQQVIRFDVSVGDVVVVEKRQGLRDPGEPPDDVLKVTFDHCTSSLHPSRDSGLPLTRFHLHDPHGPDSPLPVDGNDSGVLREVEHVLPVRHQDFFAPVAIGTYSLDWAIQFKVTADEQS